MIRTYTDNPSTYYVMPPLLTAKTLSEENPPHQQLTNPVERIHTGHQYRPAIADLITDCRNALTTLKNPLPTDALVWWWYN